MGCELGHTVATCVQRVTPCTKPFVCEFYKDVTPGADDECITIEKLGNTTRIVIDDLAKCAVLLNDSTAKELYYKLGKTFNLG